jgi:hypothetical protein
MMAEGDLYRVVAPNFVAGVVAKDGRVVKAAPILRWALGKPLEELRNGAEARGGTVTIVAAESP